MVSSTRSSAASSSSSYYSCASSSSRASSSKRSLYGRNSASTSMASLESCRPAKRCSCELIDDIQLKNLYLDHARSTDGLWHGPLPINEWKERFLPSSESASYKLDLDAVPDVHDAITLEDYIARNVLCATVFPRATLGVHGKDHTTNTLLSADFSLLSEDMKMDHDSRHVRDELLSRTLAFGDIVSEEYDPCPFADEKPDQEEAAYTRGRLAAIMRAVAVNSHRTFCYAFVLMPELARLIRFDHAGIVFSELFSWRSSGDLINFLVSFDRMSPAQRGCDTSVLRIASDSAEAMHAREILADSDALPDGVENSSVIPGDYRGTLSLMNVYDDEENVYHRVVVHRPIKSAEHYVGRSTLGFYGVDLDEKVVVYVKDAWRIASSNAAPEAATYRRLGKHKVPYLPGFYCGGDVPHDSNASIHPSHNTSAAPSVQSTRSQLFMKDHDDMPPRSINSRFHAHVHHRLLFKKIGSPLKSFKSTLQLCTSLMHGLKSHGAAYEDAKILHRDISGNNIMIDKDGRGMLIDWDMCVWLENKEEAERTGQKIGTWAYISASLLMGREERPHLLRDDLESFVHVLYYYVFRYRPSVPAGSARQTELFSSIERVFNSSLRTKSGNLAGGYPKCLYLRSPAHFDPDIMEAYVQPLPLLELMLMVREAFEPIYASKPIVDESRDNEMVGDDLEDLQEYQEAFDAALARLQSSAYLISLFYEMTVDYDPVRFQWLPEDDAVDQFVQSSTSSDPALVPARSLWSRKRSVDSIDDGGTPAGKVQCTAASRDVSAGAESARASAHNRSNTPATRI